MDADLKQYLEAMEKRLNEHINTTLKGLESSLKGRGKGLEGRENRPVELDSVLDGRLVELEHGLERRLIEKMRDMQTELLRAFAAASEDETIRLRKM
jgi:hypothetical protein